MVEELINKVFAARTAAHIAHWKTKSYAQHEALGEFYDDVIDALDKYIEAHQGGFGLVGKVDGEAKDITQMIRDEMLWINENRAKIARGVPALENILDEISSLHMKALYKLENLR
jgi:hypothetical protein